MPTPCRLWAAPVPAPAAWRGGRRRADLLLGEHWRARQAAYLPALLVGHQQQRRAHRVTWAGVGRLERPDHRADLRQAGDVVTEEDDAGGVAVPDQLEQGGRRVEAAVAVDH